MTTDTYEASGPYTIAGTGPYAIDAEFVAAADIACFIEDAGVITLQLDPADYTVDPIEFADSGTVTLTSAIATTHAGKKLWIDRVSAPVQGWLGDQSSREKALERQLDYLTQSVQDLKRIVARTAQLPLNSTFGTPAIPAPTLNAALIGTAAGWANGPTADEIANAQGYAAAAEAALDDFTDIYLGAKAADPTVDNDGDPLQIGAQYFNTTTNVLKVYTGAAWKTYVTAADLGLGTADAVQFGSLGVTGDLAVDTDTFYVDSTTDRVGINKNSGLEAALHVNGGAASGAPIAAIIAGDTTASALNDEIVLALGTNGANADVRAVHLAAVNVTGTTQEHDFVIRTSAPASAPAEAMRVTGDKKVGIGKTNPTVELDVEGIVRTKVYTVATLPTPASAGPGARAMVSDATATTFASIVSGGGINSVPVYCTGAAWLIG